MDYWNDSASSLFQGARADMGDSEVGFGDRFAPRDGEASEAIDSATGGLTESGLAWATPLVDEWGATQTAFFDVMHFKTGASVALTERNYRQSIANDDPSLMQAYWGITSGIAGGFAKVVGDSFAGIPSLVAAPIDTLRNTNRAALESGIAYALADTPEKLHMLANGATQLSVGTAMWGAGAIGKSGGSGPLLGESEGIALRREPDKFAGQRKSAPPADHVAEPADWAEFFGSAYAAKEPLLHRDFSSGMYFVGDALLYPAPLLAGHLRHTIASQLVDGDLRFTVTASGAPSVSREFGYGNEMVQGMFRAYEKSGRPIDSITGLWRTRGVYATNYNQFLDNLATRVSPEVAAANTFTGKQAAEFGFTRAQVSGDAMEWLTQGVEAKFTKPDWGSTAEWANYANAWVRAMGQR